MRVRPLAVYRVALLTAVLLCCSVFSAAASEGWTRALMGPADRLWAALPAGSRIAVAPLDPDTSGLPETLLRELERAVAAALLATAPPGSEVSSRRALPMAWEEAESFGRSAGGRLLAQAAVDALAVASVTEQSDGVTLSGMLLAVREGSVGDVLATLAPVTLPIDAGAFALGSAEAGARRLGVALAEGLRAAVDPAAAFTVRVRPAEEAGAVTDWLAGLVAEHLTRRLARAPRYVSRPLRRLGDAPGPRAVRLDLTVWDQGDRAELQARAIMDRAVTRASVRIAVASIPRTFLPLTRDGGRVGRGFLQAAGHYEPRLPTDRREVLFAARVLARAALVERALGSGTGERRGREGGDMARAMIRLSDAVPHEEIWRDGPASPAGAVQTLRARLAPVGGGRAPVLQAALERAIYRAGERLSVRVLVRGGRAHVAAFAWQADDTVVRIAPLERDARRIEAETRIDLPGPGDPEIAPAPLPGSRETLEAVIVVASALPFAADALAPSAGATAVRSLADAVEMSAFLDSLVDLDLARTSLAILPYRVRATD